MQGTPHRRGHCGRNHRGESCPGVLGRPGFLEEVIVIAHVRVTWPAVDVQDLGCELADEWTSWEMNMSVPSYRSSASVNDSTVWMSRWCRARPLAGGSAVHEEFDEVEPALSPPLRTAVCLKISSLPEHERTGMPRTSLRA